MLRAVKPYIMAMAVFYMPAVTTASMIQYTIDVTVDVAGVAPGSYPDNPWSFGPLPATYTGTFDADDAIEGGAISNFSMVIGGLDIIAIHPLVYANRFFPSTLTLNWLGFSSDSAVGLGTTAMNEPSNYAVGFEDNVSPPNDPYWGYTQNWSGTYVVSPSTAVPEPGSLTLVGLGAFGLVAGAIRRRRQAVK